MSVIDGWLLEDQDAPKKQRHTARRVWQRLVAEHDAALSEVTVSRYVARRRIELGLQDWEVSIPQTHLAGAEAEVDFGEFYSVLNGQDVKCWMFVMRLSHSGRAFHIAFGTQAQEAFLEGHVLAFEHFGGIPGRVRYDNLKPAVVRVMKGRDRAESERFTAPCGRTMDSTRSSADPASKAHTRRVVSRARSAGSDAVTWSRCRRRNRWQG